MKLLRNPWVTGVLVLVAVATVSYQFFPRNWHFPSHASKPHAEGHAGHRAPLQNSRPTAAKSSGAKNAEPAAPASSSREDRPKQKMDQPTVAAHFASWVASPRRDPFLLMNMPRNRFAGAAATNSPVSHWTLSAIWHQTGSRLAVINNQIHGEGDMIQGYQIEKIEGDEVWLQRSNQAVRLGFPNLGRIAEVVAPGSSANSTELSAPGTTNDNDTSP